MTEEQGPNKLFEPLKPYLDKSIKTLLDKTYHPDSQSLLSIHFIRAIKKTSPSKPASSAVSVEASVSAEGSSSLAASAVNAPQYEVAAVLFRPEYTIEDTKQTIPEKSQILTNFEASSSNWTKLTYFLSDMVRDNPYLLTDTIKKNMDYGLYQRNYGDLAKKGSTLTPEDDAFIQVLTSEHDKITTDEAKYNRVKEIKEAEKNWVKAIPDKREQQKHIKEILYYIKNLSTTNSVVYERIKSDINLFDGKDENILIIEIFNYFNNTLEKKWLGGEDIQTTNIQPYKTTHKTLSQTVPNKGTRRKKEINK